MPDFDEFVRLIVEHPDTIEPRVVFADYLEERGDPRAELVRMPAMLESLSRYDREYKKLRTRERILLREHGLFAAAPTGVRVLSTRGGFVDAIWLNYRKFIRSQKELFATFPLRSVRLVGRPPRIAELLESPYLARLESLELELDSIGEAELIRFATSDKLCRLRGLIIHTQPVTRLGVEAISRLSHLRELRRFGILCAPDSKVISMLATSPVIKQLEWFRLIRYAEPGSVMQDLHDADFDAGENLQRLRHVHIYSLSDRELETLHRACGGVLEELRMSGSQFERGFHQCHFPQLRRLWLRGYAFRPGRLEPTMLKAILDAHGELRDLNLSGNQLDDVAASVLAEHPQYQRLRRLGLCDNRITEQGARALGESAFRPRGAEVFLDRNSMTREEEEVIVEEFGRAMGSFGSLDVPMAERVPG